MWIQRGTMKQKDICGEKMKRENVLSILIVMFWLCWFTMPSYIIFKAVSIGGYALCIIPFTSFWILPFGSFVDEYI